MCKESKLNNLYARFEILHQQCRCWVELYLVFTVNAKGDNGMTIQWLEKLHTIINKSMPMMKYPSVDISNNYTLIWQEDATLKAGMVWLKVSLWTVLMCRLRFDTTLNALSHISHIKGFSSLWTSMCCFNLLWEENCLAYCLHQNGLTWNMVSCFLCTLELFNCSANQIHLRCTKRKKWVMKTKKYICKEIYRKYISK